MKNFLQISLPVREAIAAWAAAASTAGALLPNMVAKCLTHENWEGGRIPQADEDEESIWDAFRIVEACVAACRNLYEEDSSFDIAGDQLEASPRVAAAMAASPTLQAQGWD